MWGCLPLRTALFRLASLDLFRVQGSAYLIQVKSAGRADAFLYCLPATCRLPGLFFAPSPACFVVVVSNLGNSPVTGAFLCPFSCLFFVVMSNLAHSRKEMFQPHLPVRLPCYDLAPITGLTLGRLFTPDFRHSRLSWLDGRCVQGPGTYSPRHG